MCGTYVRVYVHTFEGHSTYSAECVLVASVLAKMDIY